MPAKRKDVKVRKNLIAEAERILATTELPERRVVPAWAPIRLALTDALTEVPRTTILGHKEQENRVELGPDYFNQIVTMRRRRMAAGRKARLGRFYIHTGKQHLRVLLRKGPIHHPMESLP